MLLMSMKLLPVPMSAKIAATGKSQKRCKVRSLMRKRLVLKRVRFQKLAHVDLYLSMGGLHSLKE
jgi:hypothetical protein